MKKALMALAAFAFASLAAAHDYTVGLTPSTAAISTTSASAYAGTGGGVSLSGAYNQQNAGVDGTKGGAAVGLGPLKSASVGVAGGATTSGLSAAGNLSVGNASGSAQATGLSQASIVGSGSAWTVNGGPQAVVNGNAEAVTGTSAASGSNGLGVSAGSAVGVFDAAASATQIKVGPFQTADVNSHAVASGVTTPSIQIQVGSGTVSIQNEAAANAFGQAKVGNLVSTN